jgi:hypothetical protein
MQKSEGTLKRWNAVDDPPFWMVDGANEVRRMHQHFKKYPNCDI